MPQKKLWTPLPMCLLPDGLVGWSSLLLPSETEESLASDVNLLMNSHILLSFAEMYILHWVMLLFQKKRQQNLTEPLCQPGFYRKRSDSQYILKIYVWIYWNVRLGYMIWSKNPTMAISCWRAWEPSNCWVCDTGSSYCWRPRRFLKSLNNMGSDVSEGM